MNADSAQMVAPHAVAPPAVLLVTERPWLTEGLKGARMASRGCAIAGAVLALLEWLLCTIRPYERMATGIQVWLFVLLIDVVVCYYLGAVLGFVVGSLGPTTSRHGALLWALYALTGCLIGTAFAIGSCCAALTEDELRSAWIEAGRQGTSDMLVILQLCVPNIAYYAPLGAVAGVAVGLVVKLARAFRVRRRTGPPPFTRPEHETIAT